MSNDGDDTPSDIPSLHKLESPTGSPPKQASLSDVMELENCVSNLSLAHEIVVNSDFRFRQNSPSNASLEGRVKEIVHQAFWDSLQLQLNSSPPDYTHAFVLLHEVKATLLSLLLPGHVRLRAQIEEVLDLDLIQQEATHGALDLQRLSGYIIDTMASLCAPVRDSEIRALRELVQPVDLLREIFRVCGLMKTDMVNFTVNSLRPQLLQQAVQYERAKFQQILDKRPDSLDSTACWLQMAAQEEASSASPHSEAPMSLSHGPVSPTAVLNRAYLSLLHWDPQGDNYPETVLLDRVRLDSLGRRFSLLVLEASVMLLTSTQCGATVFCVPGFVGKLRQTVHALLEGSHSRAFDLKGALQGLGDQVVIQVHEAGSTHGGGSKLGQDRQDLLKGQISDLEKDNNTVRRLIGDRIQAYLGATLEASASKESPALPAALGSLSAELAELGTTFGRIVHFNRSVYGPFYAPLLRRLLCPQGEADMGEDSR
ncbi:T-complex protein 11-like protein 2 [Aplochiton taeniatus]